MVLLTLALVGETVFLDAPARGATVPVCVGDCDGDGTVRVNEIVLVVDTLLGSVPAGACLSPTCEDGSIACVVQAVDNALNGCTAPTPTPAASITYDLVIGNLGRFIPDRAPAVQLLSGTFQAGITRREGGDQITLTRIDFRGGSLEPIVVTGSGVIDVPAADLLTMTAMVSINGESFEMRGEEPTSVLSGYPPTIDHITVCGAPDGAVSCDALQAGTAAGYALTITAVPEGPQTPGPTRTPTPVVFTRYRLVEGSSIALHAPTGGDPTPDSHPLAGTFIVAPCALVPNTFFAYVVTGVNLEGGSQFVVSGAEPGPMGCPGGVGVGYTDALTLMFPPEVYMQLHLVINGREVPVGGRGPFDQRTFTLPPTLENLHLCGSPDRAIACQDVGGGSDIVYELLISAVPEE